MTKKSSTVREAVKPKSKKVIKVKTKSPAETVKKIARGVKAAKSTSESQTVEQQLAQRERGARHPQQRRRSDGKNARHENRD